ncbi:MAG: hypothetical protein ABSB41_17420 [Anaerolineales bacterium]|jgi:hypothetical protein
MFFPGPFGLLDRQDDQQACVRISSIADPCKGCLPHAFHRRLVFDQAEEGLAQLSAVYSKADRPVDSTV